MEKLPRIYISPVNLTIYNAISSFNSKNIGYIVSQRQHNNKGGYVDAKVIELIRESDCTIIRDHFWVPREMDNDERTKIIEYDADFFNIIHIDPWFKGMDQYSPFSGLLWVHDFIHQHNQVKFEFGTEDYIAQLTIQDYQEQINMLKSYKNNIVYLVCQGGSVVFNLENQGPIDVEKTGGFVKLAKKHNMKVKRHNCDFHSDEELKQLCELGVDAFNFAPEFSSIYNKVIFDNLETKDKGHLLKRIILETPWQRWVPESSEESKLFISCLHYIEDEAVQRIIDSHGDEIKEKIQERLTQLCEIIPYGV